MGSNADLSESTADLIKKGEFRNHVGFLVNPIFFGGGGEDKSWVGNDIDPWYLNKMVAQNMLCTYDAKLVEFDDSFDVT